MQVWFGLGMALMSSQVTRPLVEDQVLGGKSPRGWNGAGAHAPPS